ncbi:hypothetical protein GUJ93_ZPchr0015g6683 [Zizania palustris]|uniref:Uncharacterized protein n=1 Tax=Zizania palustris TaxID=103762 RepID=A0A8J5W656_ZIZPA|nr:hypothetical protein GUJ93_ZPchr0015g6683 [Zizania palustris]
MLTATMDMSPLPAPYPWCFLPTIDISPLIPPCSHAHQRVIVAVSSSRWWRRSHRSCRRRSSGRWGRMRPVRRGRPRRHPNWFSSSTGPAA